jgi:poly-gamma-glutamate capsule biosynthesis protein CapA/YwtB (metallophosphatase superfamily)
MMYDAEQGTIKLAVVGDAMISRPMSPFREPEFIEVLKILRGVDASIANLEQLFHRYEMSWSNKESYSYQASDPTNLDELAWMGFQAVSTATNHAYDYNEQGFLTTLRHCDANGLLQAGGGMNLGEARAPALLDTAAGRVALMSVSTTFAPESRAAGGRPDFPGKPGINALRHHRTFRVPSESFEAIQQLNRGLFLDEEQEARRGFQPHTVDEHDPETEVRFEGQAFQMADQFGVETRCNKKDLKGIGDWIRGASKQADWLVYGFHGHESASSGPFHGGSRIHPPDFHTEFAHFAIDQGCDVVAGHGPHFLRGIEIYKNRPIFYSLGNFIFQNETIQRVPPPGYSRQGLGHDHTPGDWGETRSGGGQYGFAADPVFYRSVVAVCSFVEWDLHEILLYPISLGFGKPMSQRGRPVIATGEEATAILSWLQHVSEPFRTQITIEDGVGVIHASSSPTGRPASVEHG